MLWIWFLQWFKLISSLGNGLQFCIFLFSWSMDIFGWCLDWKGWLFFNLFYWLSLWFFNLALLQLMGFLSLRFGNSLILVRFLNNWLDWLSLWLIMVLSCLDWWGWILLLNNWFQVISDFRVFLWKVWIGWLSVGGFLFQGRLLGMRLWLSACAPHLISVFLIKYYCTDSIWLFINSLTIKAI